MTDIKGRVINVSNRLPILIRKHAGGARVERSSGGLATALEAAAQVVPAFAAALSGAARPHHTGAGGCPAVRISPITNICAANWSCLSSRSMENSPGRDGYRCITSIATLDAMSFSLTIALLTSAWSLPSRME